MPNGRNITGQEMIWSVKCILSCPTRLNFNKSYPLYRQIGFKIFPEPGLEAIPSRHSQYSCVRFGVAVKNF